MSKTSINDTASPVLGRVAPQSRFRVLLVEDSQVDAMLARRLLAQPTLQNRYEVSHCATLEAGLKELTTGAYDVVLLDLGLPDSTGLETFAAARAVANCAIVVISSLDDDVVARQAVQMGAQDYVLKEDLNTRFLEREIVHACERYRLVVELEGARDKAQSASEAKSQFLAVMSHEFRTPMNGIVGGIDLLRRSPMDKDAKEILQMMKDCAVSQMELINDVLDLSKIEAGKLDILDEPFDIADLAMSVTSALSYRAESKNLAFRASIDPAAPRHIVSDPRRIRQVLVNLLGNAIKFTEAGEVSLLIMPVGARRLRFVVRDTGIGIDEDKLSFVFEPFTQVDSSYKRRFQGSGLGLAICRRLSEMLGGSISVESKLGVGSTFVFDLPYEEVSQEMLGLPPLEQAEMEGFPRLSADYPLSVLIVEDNPTSRRVIEATFSKFGYEPQVASDGDEAVRIAGSNCFDLIVMDLQMPKTDGLEATRRILERYRDRQSRPFVSALTACASERDRVVCLEAGMDCFLTKPLGVDQIQSLIKLAYKSKQRSA